MTTKEQKVPYTGSRKLTNASIKQNERGGIESKWPKKLQTDYSRTTPTYHLIILLLTVSLFNVACSKTTFSYNQLDWLLPWYLNRFVNLDQDQERYLDSLLSPFLDWHRAEELPKYLQIFKDFEGLLDDEITPADLERLEDEIEHAWVRLERRSLDWLINLATILSAKQVEDFFQKLKTQQNKYEKKYLPRTDAEFVNEARKELVGLLKKYLGSITPEQRKFIDSQLLDLKRSDRTWLDERAQWIDRVEKVLERKPYWQDNLKKLLVDREKNLSEDYLRVYEWNTSVIRNILVRNLNSRSKKQDRKLRNEVAKWKRDLEILIAQSKGAS